MRAPWRWHWGRIAGLVALWSGTALVCWYAPILWLAVAGWFVLWIRAGDTEPLPHGVDSPSRSREEAGQRDETPLGEGPGGGVVSQYGGAQVTIADPAGTHRFDVRG